MAARRSAARTARLRARDVAGVAVAEFEDVRARIALPVAESPGGRSVMPNYMTDQSVNVKMLTKQGRHIAAVRCGWGERSRCIDPGNCCGILIYAAAIDDEETDVR